MVGIFRSEDVLQVTHPEFKKAVGLPEAAVEQAAGSVKLKLEKEVRSGDKGLEVIHIDVIADAKQVDELTMKV